jgi:hypothetical protein
MSVPNINAHSSVDVSSSCNGPFCCFGRKKHKHRSDCDKKIATVVSTAQLQIATPEDRKPISRHEEKAEIGYVVIPRLVSSPELENVKKKLDEGNTRA